MFENQDPKLFFMGCFYGIAMKIYCIKNGNIVVFTLYKTDISLLSTAVIYNC